MQLTKKLTNCDTLLHGIMAHCCPFIELHSLLLGQQMNGLESFIFLTLGFEYLGFSFVPQDKIQQLESLALFHRNAIFTGKCL